MHCSRLNPVSISSMALRFRGEPNRMELSQRTGDEKSVRLQEACSIEASLPESIRRLFQTQTPESLAVEVENLMVEPPRDDSDYLVAAALREHASQIRQNRMSPKRNNNKEAANDLTFLALSSGLFKDASTMKILEEADSESAPLYRRTSRKLTRLAMQIREGIFAHGIQHGQGWIQDLNRDSEYLRMQSFLLRP